MSNGAGLLSCNACDAPPARADACQTAKVRSNIRRFRSEEFVVWRCASCRSLHARDAVPLDAYYRDYPFLKSGPDKQREPVYERLVARLERAGVTRDQRILDFGCGAGSFVRFLRRSGFAASGYDAYMEEYADRSVLEQSYDCVFSQDVLEHVEDPRELMRQFARLARPSGLVVIGTPEASAIDLRRSEEFVHALHMPYHRHILSASALRAEAARLGWQLAHYYPTSHGSRLAPGHNPRFGHYYMRCYDDCLDVLTEPLNPSSWKLYTPAAAFWFFFGAFFDRRTDVMFVFRTPPADTDPNRDEVGANGGS